MKSETRRLNKLKDASKNEAKRYKLPAEAVKPIEKYGKVHGQQSRAIQIAVEILWRVYSPSVPLRTPDSILNSPIVGKTYKLPPRTVHLIEALAGEYETRGKVLAACAALLDAPEPRRTIPRT